MEEKIDEVVAIGTIAIAVFGIASCLMQRRFRWVGQRFALFLLAVLLNNLAAAALVSLGPEPGLRVQFIFETVWFLGLISLAPAFWAYVHALTSTSETIPRLGLHLILPGFALLLLVFVVLSPTATRSEADLADAGLLLSMTFVANLLVLVWPVQLAVYIMLFMRRLVRYRRRLRDLYASTEERELSWIVLLGVFAGLFWLIHTVDILSLFGTRAPWVPSLIYNIIGFSLFFAATLWGLRQRPGLIPSDATAEPANKQGAKYARSAITPEVSARIARKLKAAMELDKCHHDPTLSLWSLAKHVGATPNYVSQTLNDVIEKNFFDFVNGYRIADATRMLAETEETILAIAYDVGFNTKSSFYTAFKRVTGRTPSAYRKEMSKRRGLDDQTA